MIASWLSVLTADPAKSSAEHVERTPSGVAKPNSTANIAAAIRHLLAIYSTYPRKGSEHTTFYRRKHGILTVSRLDGGCAGAQSQKSYERCLGVWQMLTCYL